MTPDDFKKLLDEALQPINKRLEGIEGQLNDPESGLATLKKGQDKLRQELTEVKDTQEQQVLPSVVTIEIEIKAYADMYKINNSNAKKLEKRIEVIEDKSGITPPPEFTLVDVV